MTTVRDHLVESIQYAGRGIDGDESPAAAILWTDPERLWESVIENLSDDLTIVTLGPYEPDRRSGPAIWIRTVVAGFVDEIQVDPPPIVYMPGVSRDDIRNLEDCPDELKPLVELQYRGAFWTQPNGRDWTPIAFLVNEDRGLGMRVRSDDETLNAIDQTLGDLLERSTEWLRRNAPIDSAALYSLVEDDPVRTLLRWINDPDSLDALSPAERSAFRKRCRDVYELDIDDGPIDGARKLAYAEDDWRAVWLRFREAPDQYPGIGERLRQAAPAGQTSLALGIDEMDPTHAWPQHNESEEKSLREALAAAVQRQRDDLVPELDRLEAIHGQRRRWVWAQLGRAPLAEALRHLVALAERTSPVKKGSVPQMAEWYADQGWRVEDAVMRALGSVVEHTDQEAVGSVIDALYGSWSDHVARIFQQAVISEPDAYRSLDPTDRLPGTCLLFTDGLRLDLGYRLADEIRSRGLDVAIDTHLAALPTITATAKPALTPVAGSLQSGPGLEPTTNGSTKVNVSVLRSTLNAAGYQTLGRGEIGDTSGRAWTEIGSVDSDGHAHGPGLAGRVEADLEEIAIRVKELANGGWRHVEIVTDHGFLLMPAPMHKAELSAHLVEYRKGRCARLGEGDEVDYATVPWRWDPSVRWAMAPGTACFEAGKRYEHGGLSLPECVVPHLTVTRDLTVQPVTLARPVWRGMRMIVEVEGNPASIDLRSKPADPTSSLLVAPVTIAEGVAKAVVEDTDAEGMAAVVVALGEDGGLLSQIQTVVGEM